MNVNKLYSIKRPSHPDTAHTKSKRYFKRKGRRMVRRLLKDMLRNELNEGYHEKNKNSW